MLQSYSRSSSSHLTILQDRTRLSAWRTGAKCYMQRKSIQIKTKLAKREQALSRKVSVTRKMITQHILQVSRFETEGKIEPVFERNYLQHFLNIKMPP